MNEMSMDEQTTWKGHTFTLLVFTGIVVLCSIFFILGMLVGRAQGQKIASTTTQPDILKVDPEPEPKDDKTDFTFYDSVKKEQSAVLEPAPAKPAPLPAAPPPSSKPENVLNYQIGALRQAADAEKLLDAVKKKGFRAFILAPPANDANPLFRVQVGPFADSIAAQDAKKKLEAAGYQPILKK
jgi:cell division septation protein DedD